MEVSRSADDDASATNSGNFWNDPPGTDTVDAILSLGNSPARERSSHSGSTATLGGNGNPGDPGDILDFKTQELLAKQISDAYDRCTF